MKKIILFLVLSTTMPIHIQSAASQPKTAKKTEQLNERLHRAFMNHDYPCAADLLAKGVDAKKALEKCSEQTPHGLIVGRSVFGGMKLFPSPFSQQPTPVNKEEWLELLKPHGIVDIVEYK